MIHLVCAGTRSFHLAQAHPQVDRAIDGSFAIAERPMQEVGTAETATPTASFMLSCYSAEIILEERHQGARPTTPVFVGRDAVRPCLRCTGGASDQLTESLGPYRLTFRCGQGGS